MRLVSALYAGFNPFDLLDVFDDYAVVETHDDLQRGDVLISHGGADIPPEFYGKGRSSRSGSSGISRRDAIEWAMMHRAKELDVPIIGICRGAQMLCALEGGYLYQHVDNHGGSHTITAKDVDNSIIKLEVNSIHHQMMKLY